MNPEAPAKVIQARREALSLRQGYRDLVLKLLAIALVLWILFSFVFTLCRVSGNNMYPAVKDGDVVLAYRLQQKYEKDDVVVFRAEGKRAVGRLVAFQTDTVDMDENGTFYVNGTAQEGQILFPTYAKNAGSYPYTLQEGECFILCDYRTKCRDSRDYGAIKTEDVEGKVITLLRRRSL